jgi:hypothetical protein
MPAASCSSPPTALLRIIPEFIAGYTLYRLAPLQRPGGGNGALLAGLAAIAALAFLPAVTVVLLLPAIMLLMLGLYSGGSLVETLLTVGLAFVAYCCIEVPGRALVGAKLGLLEPATVVAQ